MLLTDHGNDCTGWVVLLNDLKSVTTMLANVTGSLESSATKFQRHYITLHQKSWIPPRTQLVVCCCFVLDEKSDAFAMSIHWLKLIVWQGKRESVSWFTLVLWFVVMTDSSIRCSDNGATGKNKGHILAAEETCNMSSINETLCSLNLFLTQTNASFVYLLSHTLRVAMVSNIPVGVFEKDVEGVMMLCISIRCNLLIRQCVRMLVKTSSNSPLCELLALHRHLFFTVRNVLRAMFLLSLRDVPVWLV